MAEAVFNEKDILTVTPAMIDEIKKKAAASPRGRYRLCLHRSTDDRTQEMIIVFRKGTYMPPHRHPKGKSESYHIIEGSMAVFIFNDGGKVAERIDLKAFGSGKPFMIRVSDKKWHMPVPLSEWLVYHETYSGPFVKEEDVEFPSWAPVEGDRSITDKYVADLTAGRKE